MRGADDRGIGEDLRCRDHAVLPGRSDSRDGSVHQHRHPAARPARAAPADARHDRATAQRRAGRPLARQRKDRQRRLGGGV